MSARPTAPYVRVQEIVHDRRRLSVDMALRLSRYFGTSERFWLNLQNEIDIRNRRESLARDLETIHPIGHSA
ncbi:MAG: HigA family addiction module antitoxin [Spirochaetaceae bacterium]